jgi:hypothetical protein
MLCRVQRQGRPDDRPSSRQPLPRYARSCDIISYILLHSQPFWTTEGYPSNRTKSQSCDVCITKGPTVTPTLQPSRAPTTAPTPRPTTAPTLLPTTLPSMQPTQVGRPLPLSFCLCIVHTWIDESRSLCTYHVRPTGPITSAHTRTFRRPHYHAYACTNSRAHSRADAWSNAGKRMMRLIYC